MMRTVRTLLSLAVIGVVVPAGTVAGFELKNGDSVVFIGDTMTDISGYADLVENFVRIRYPQLDVRFFTSGWRDETATQGLARVDRDVLSLDPKPTVAIVQYGMYDAGLRAFEQPRLDEYKKSLDEIVGKLKAAGCRTWVVTPLSVDEDMDRTKRLGDANYNEVLARYADAADGVARKHGAQVLDFFKITTATRIKEREHNRRFAYSRNGYTPDYVAATLLATELLKAWKAEPVNADITLDWATKKATIASGSIELQVISDDEILIKLNQVPMLWPYVPRTRTAPMYWPLAELSHMVLTVKNCPDTGLLLGSGAAGERALPMLKMQLEPGLDLARFEPVRSLEPISLIARLVRQKNVIRTRNLWRELELNPTTQPELKAAQKANEEALELYVLGYLKWIQNTPKKFDATLKMTSIDAAALSEAAASSSSNN